MTRAEKFRTGGRIAWVGGGLFSGSLLYSLSPQKGIVAFVICVILAFAFQYLLTIVESVMIYGEIPHPFHKDSTVAHKWMWATSFACLAIDTYINYNGIMFLLELLNKNGEMNKDTMIGASVILSILVAMAPEVCNAYCDMLEGKGKQVNIKQKDKLPFNEDQTLVQSNRDLSNQNNGLRTRLNELEQQLKKANKEPNQSTITIDDNLNIGRRKR